MAEGLHLLVCANYLAEASAALAAEADECADVRVSAFPDLCLHPQAAPVTALDLLGADDAEAEQQTMLVGACFLAGQPARRKACDPRRVYYCEQCFHLLAGRSLIDSYLRAGAYLVTPGWLAHWGRHLQQWGFTQATARAFFGECATRLVLLDTGVDPESQARLAACADYLDLPTALVPVGLDHLRLVLRTVVGQWRLDRAARAAQAAAQRANRRLADYTLAFDLLVQLTRSMGEQEAIAAIVDVFTMLFGARQVVYAPVVDGCLGAVADPEGRLAADLERLGDSASHVVEAGGFCLRVAYGGETLGVLRVTEMAFPAHAHDYLNLALAIVSLCGLAIANARVVSERTQALEALERSNRDLAQFAFVASHDLQEPLRMVTSYLQLLARRYQGRLDTDADEYIAFAVDGAARMKRLISDLLAYSRVTTRGVAFGPVDLDRTLALAKADLAVAMVESGAVVEAGPLPTILGDEGQLGQLLRNLVGNAIKYRRVDPVHITVTATRTEEGWQIAVRDNGIGFDMQYADRIFGIFTRLHTREEHEGSGIGLAICRRIVERHGGRIWAESEPDVGTKFCFTLPER